MKLIFILPKVKKNIHNAILILILVNKKVFLKNQDLFTLLFIKKNAITIPEISRLEPLIFTASTPVSLIWKLSFLVNSDLLYLPRFLSQWKLKLALY